jgi:hypothetical protein
MEHGRLIKKRCRHTNRNSITSEYATGTSCGTRINFIKLAVKLKAFRRAYQ